MKRTQLYLEDDLWSALHSLARNQGTTVSDLVRRAVRDRYVGNLDERRKAMQAFVGLRETGFGTGDEEYGRNLRRGTRIERLGRT
ncbi:MAG: CopG family transcriptional regulator [Bryobacteraceae bacterium]